MAFLAIERLVDDIARLLQRVGQLPVQINVVFDYQDAHRSAFVRFKSINVLNKPIPPTSEPLP